MGITRLKRKARRNKHTAAKRQVSMQQLNSQPVIKNIDAEAIKASFASAPAKEAAAPAPVEKKAPAAKAVVEETPVAEVEAVEETVVEAPVAEATESAEVEAPAEGDEETKEEA